jgi:FkbM family methyltransferase
MKFYGQFDPPVDFLIYENMCKFDYEPLGIAVEAGAFDGQSESCCKFFEEEFGWLIVNIEPVPYIFEKCKENRPKSVNLCCAVGDRKENRIFKQAISPVHKKFFGNGSLRHTREHIEELKTQGCSFEDIKVEVDTLENILKDQHITDVDLLVLDVEGYEIDALNGLGSKIRPAFLCVEDGWDDDNIILSTITRKGYTAVEKIHNNMFFVRDDIRRKETSNWSGTTVLTLMKSGSKENNIFFNYLSTCNDQFEQLVIVHDSEKGFDASEIPESIKNKIIYVFEGEKPSYFENMDQRARFWAYSLNQGLRQALYNKPEFIIFIESDLCFPFDLISNLRKKCIGVIAPVVWLGNKFYDTWAYTQNGQPITSEKVIQADFDDDQKLDAAGSVLMMKAESVHYSRSCPWYENGLIKGFCLGLTKRLIPVQIDHSTCVIHPTTSWRNQVWFVSSLVYEGQETEVTPPYILPNLFDYWVNPLLQSVRQTLNIADETQVNLVRNDETREISLVIGIGQSGEKL